MNSNRYNHIQPYDLIKHERFMDIAMRVLHKWLRPDGGVKLEGFWVNLAFEKSFNIGIPQTIELSPEVAAQWHTCIDPHLENEPFWGKMSKSYRYSRWVPLYENKIL